MITTHRQAHRAIWAILALLLPALLVFALAIRPDPPPSGTAVELEPGRGQIR